MSQIEFKRTAVTAISELAASFPIISITGPRQSGKTTLAQSYFTEKAYFNLEDPSQRAQIMDDPKGVLATVGKNGAIFDEIQHYPELLSYLQVEADRNAIKGQYVVTGSYNFALMKSVTQSLAGRVGMVELLPMSMQEIQQSGITLSLEEFLYYGGLPRIFKDKISPTLVYKNYVKTYLERDMRDLINIKDLAAFRRFMQLCAARVGSEIIASNIGNELGVSHHTIQAWLSVLEASYVIFRLQPYFENLGKRVIKASKLYFTDVGLACYLLGIETETQLQRDPLMGRLFENLVVLDIYKHLLNRGREARIYFYRDRSQNEVDLIWQSGRSLIPIEIKLGQTYRTEFTKGLSYFEKLIPERVPYGYIIYTGESDALKTEKRWQLLNFQESFLLVENGAKISSAQ